MIEDIKEVIQVIMDRGFDRETAIRIYIELRDSIKNNDVCPLMALNELGLEPDYILALI